MYMSIAPINKYDTVSNLTRFLTFNLEGMLHRKKYIHILKCLLVHEFAAVYVFVFSDIMILNLEYSFSPIYFELWNLHFIGKVLYSLYPYRYCRIIWFKSNVSSNFLSNNGTFMWKETCARKNKNPWNIDPRNVEIMDVNY